MSDMRPSPASAGPQAVDVGDVVTLGVAITDDAGAAADAGGITLTVTQPDATPVTPAVTHSGTGAYNVQFPVTQAGRYLIRWVATGANASVYTDVLDVFAADPHYVISLADARDALGKTAADVAGDNRIRLYMAAVTTVVEAAVGPQSLTTKQVT